VTDRLTSQRPAKTLSFTGAPETEETLQEVRTGFVLGVEETLLVALTSLTQKYSPRLAGGKQAQRLMTLPVEAVVGGVDPGGLKDLTDVVESHGCTMTGSIPSGAPVERTPMIQPGCRDGRSLGMVPSLPERRSVNAAGIRNPGTSTTRRACPLCNTLLTGRTVGASEIARDTVDSSHARSWGRIRPAGLRLGLRTRLPATPESAHHPRADRQYHNDHDGDDHPIERGGTASVPPSTVLGEEHRERSKGHWQRLLLLEHRICMLVLEEGLTRPVTSLRLGALIT
jgi:hypothetical protein